MPDSVEDWDSLWKRTTRWIDVTDIEDKEEFQQRMMSDFFRDYTNPKGMTGRHSRLVDELWEFGIKEDRFPEVIRIREEEARKVEVERFEKMIKEDRWKRRYRELLEEGIAPESAYDTVMEEIRGEEEARKAAVEEVIEEIEEVLPEVKVPSERAVTIRMTKYEKMISEEPLEREKYERLHKTLERSLAEEYGLE